MRERLDRVWPSLVALVGTVGVVVVLLIAFGDNTGDADADDIALNDDADEVEDEDPGDEPEPTDSATEEPPDDEATDEGADEDEDEDAEPDEEPTTAPPELRSPVGIANQTSVAGLEQIAQERIEAGGWEVPATSPFNGSVPETTVYYPPGMEESAEALARQFPEIARVEPTFEGVNQTRLVVVLVDDYLETVDE